jgi:hypothetical protein
MTLRFLAAQLFAAIDRTCQHPRANEMEATHPLV